MNWAVTVTQVTEQLLHSSRVQIQSSAILSNIDLLFLTAKRQIVDKEAGNGSFNNNEQFVGKNLQCTIIIKFKSQTMLMKLPLAPLVYLSINNADYLYESVLPNIHAFVTFACKILQTWGKWLWRSWQSGHLRYQRTRVRIQSSATFI